MSDQKIYQTEEEKELAQKLQSLSEEWEAAWNRYKTEHRGEYGVDSPDKPIIRYGFYPNYLSQNPKILFIGRECYSLDDSPDYIDLFVQRYKAGMHPNGTSMNQDKFHKLLLKVAYGIINDIADFDSIPQPSEICGEKIFDSFSFAFMNLSNLSNEGERYASSDWDLIKTSFLMSVSPERNFIHDEVRLLDPDLIIIMNWGTHCFVDQFDQDRQTLRMIFKDEIDIKKDEWLKYTLHWGEKEVLLLDQWHFSSTKSEKKDIYDPIYNAWQKFKELREAPDVPGAPGAPDAQDAQDTQDAR